MIEELRTAAEIVRRADWLSDLLAETRQSPSPSDLAALQSAVATTSGGLATVLEQIADLLEDPEADPVGTGADLIAGAVDLIRGLIDLVDRLTSTVGATLQLDNALNMVLLLLASVLEELEAGASGALWALGLIEMRRVQAPTLPVPITVRRAAGHRLGLLFRDPQAYLVDRIHDRESPLASSGFLAALATLTGERILDAGHDEDWLRTVEDVRNVAMPGDLRIDQAMLMGRQIGTTGFAGATLYVTEIDAAQRVRLGVAPVVQGLTEITIPFAEVWSLRLAANLPSPAVALEIEADPTSNTLAVDLGARLDTAVGGTIALSRQPGGAGDERTFGGSGALTGHGARLGPIELDTRAFEFKTHLDVEATPLGDVDVGLGLALKQLKVALRFDDADSFLQGVVPQEALAIGFDLEIDWSQATGLVVRGAVGLELVVPLNVSLGPIALNQLALRLGFDGTTVELMAATGLQGTLGPLVVTVERMGLVAELTFPERGGNLGPAELAASFKPPSGVGLAIDAGAVTGAGYITLEPEIGRYSGFLALRVSEFAVTALGLVQVDLPQPGPEYSLLILITAEFPGIQIGYGFTLNGIGGIFGLHRKIDADALRADVANGAVSTLLDPGSRLDNPAQLIGQLERYFPTAVDHFVIGLSLQLRWVELVRLDVGVMIELPGPNKIVLLGRALIAIEAGDVAIVRIQLEVLGIIDFEARLLSIDAALRDSSLLEVFEITGGAALRLSWGDRPYALMSIGGFHPEFVPEPAVVPVPERVGLTYGEPGDFFYLRLATYVAITTGSFQLGAAVEVRLNLEVIKAEGMLAFDALIVFDPFYFSVGFMAAFKVKLFSVSLAGVSMKGVMTGPGPVTFAGEVCIEILFFKACWSGSFSIGSEAPAEIADVESVLQRFAAELRAETLRSEPSPYRGILLRSESAEAARFDPGGGLSWTQGLVPIGVIIERLEGTPLAAPVEVDLALATGDPLDDAYDWFAPASFLDLTDAEAIGRKSFERLRAGFLFDGEDRRLVSPAQEVALTPDVFVVGRPEPSRVAGPSLEPHVLAAVLARTQGARITVNAELGLEEERWEVHGGESEGESSHETTAHQVARHRGGVALPVDDLIMVGDL
ncbi:MAG: DUF6603 domain-containing protein [Myxococcota bacterium]